MHLRESAKSSGTSDACLVPQHLVAPGQVQQVNRRNEETVDYKTDQLTVPSN